MTDVTAIIQGSAPELHTSYDPATNHGYCSDANGNSNVASCAGAGGYIYDIENRLGGGTGYTYAPNNKRVWRGDGATKDEVTFWSVSGQKLGDYHLTVVSGGSSAQFYATQTGTNYYFGSKLIKNAGGWVYTDRLGSIGKYYPYGTERPTTANGKEKFATYFRDSETGLDYADQRYESPGTGRFLTADPYRASGGPGAPGSWNRYPYSLGDPINLYDPHGRDACPPDDPCSDGDEDGPPDVWQGGGDGGDAGGISHAPSYEANPCPNMYGKFYASCIERYYLAVSQGLHVARTALAAVSTTVFSAECQSFIDTALGAGSLELVQVLAAQTTVQWAVTVTTAAGATLFPNNPNFAAQTQAIADQRVGVTAATLSAWAQYSPTVSAYGQYMGDTVFINNAGTTWANAGSGWALYTMLHEMLHVAGLGGDAQIEKLFGISPEIVAAQGSSSITYKLMGECGR